MALFMLYMYYMITLIASMFTSLTSLRNVLHINTRFGDYTYSKDFRFTRFINGMLHHKSLLKVNYAESRNINQRKMTSSFPHIF